MDASIKEILSSQKQLKQFTNGLKAEIADLNKKWPNTWERIKEDIENACPRCEVHLFGSRLIGLVTKDSDCDIYLDYNRNSYDSELTNEDQIGILNEFKYFLKCFSIKCILKEARVPLLMVHHKTTDMDCDISCRSGLSVENSILTRQFLSSDYRVSWLVITVRWWMNANGLLGKHKFNSYTTTWLVLFFLMCNEPCFLSCILDLKKGCTKKSIGHWDCTFNRDIIPSKQSYESRTTLLVNFFNFYSKKVQFGSVVLSPLTASMMHRRNFDTSNLPTAYESYIAFKKLNPDEGLETGTALCLQDPFELSYNIARGVKQEDLDKFQRFCGESYEICRKSLFESYATFN